MRIEAQIVGAREFVTRFGAIPERMRGNLRTAMVAGQYILRSAIFLLLSGEVLRNRTGHLRDHLATPPPEESADSITAIVGTNEVYARIQEMGGTITPKSGSYLTVPLEAALTHNGVARFTARQVIDNPGTAGAERTFFAKGVLFGASGGSIEPLFALKSSVTLPARPYMSVGLERAQGQISDRLAAAVAAAMGE